MSTPPESLSALVDDELDAFPESLQQSLKDDPALRETWSRYHLIGDVLRQGNARAAVARLDLRVAAALADEPVIVAPVAARRSRATSATPLERTKRFALAAAVAGLALGGALFGSFSKSQLPGQEMAVAGDAPSADGAQPVAWNAAGEPGTPEAGDFRRRMNSYLMRFSEQRAGLAVPNVHPYVRVVGFEQEGGR